MAKSKSAGKGESAAPEKRRTIIQFVRDLFTEDPEIATDAVIEAVLAEFPDSKINKAHVGWYRSKFREEGMDIPRRRRVTTDETAEPKAAKAAKKRSKTASKRKKVT